MTLPKDVLGPTTFQVQVRAGLRPHAAQSAAAKSIHGCEALTPAEVPAWREIANRRALPREGGYAETWIRKGRRAGGTSHLAAPFVVSALLTSPARLNQILAPGERARVLLIGPGLAHVDQLLDTTAGTLDRLHVPYVRRDREIDLTPAGLRTIAVATVADHLGPRSGTAIACVVDEAALLPFDENADGYDVELFAAIRPALATTGGRLLVLSSPWAQRGVHFDTVRRFHGKNDPRVLALHGPTWTWNPMVSEAKTRELEADPRRWAREYAAEAGQNESALLDARDVRAAVDRGVDERPAREGVAYVVAIDVAFRHDRFAIVVAHRETKKRDGLPPLDLVVIDLVRVATPAPGQRLDFDQLMQTCANIARRYRDAKLVRDSFSGDAVDHALRTRGVRSEELSMSAPAQARRWTLVQQKFRAGAVRLVESEIAVRELCDLQLRMHAAGRIEVAAPNRKGAHDDVADAIALAIDAAMSLPATGGDIEHDVRVIWSDCGIEVRSQWFETKPAPGGGVMRVPCAPPRGSADWMDAREERRARGAWAEGDDDEPGAGPVNVGVRET